MYKRQENQSHQHNRQKAAGPEQQGSHHPVSYPHLDVYKRQAQGREKVLPILGALHGKLFNTLITDERTAMNVLIQGGKMI